MSLSWDFLLGLVIGLVAGFYACVGTIAKVLQKLGKEANARALIEQVRRAS